VPTLRCDRESMQVNHDEPHTTALIESTRVRIKVAVWPDGRWIAYGDESADVEAAFTEVIDDPPMGKTYHCGESYHWIEADVPRPVTVEGKVSSE
jgi:hypothetical protein